MQSVSSDPRLLILHRDYSLIDKEEDKISAPCCDGKKIKKWMLISIGAAGFAASGAFTALELFGGNTQPKLLEICTLLNGVAISFLVHPLLPPHVRKKVYEISSDVSYPLLFVASQLYLLLVPQQLKPIAVAGFTEALGVYLGKDLLHALSLTVADFSLSTEPPKEGKELKLMGFSPRNKKALLIILPACGVAAIAANILYQLNKDRLETGPFSVFQQIGLFQDIIAMFTCGIVGEGLIQFLDSWKERNEELHAQRLLISKPLPNSLRIARIVKTVFVVATPIVWNGLLSVPSSANSLGRYFLKGSAAGLFTAHQTIFRREFTNLQAPLHSQMNDVVEEAPKPTLEKVKTWFKSHWPAITLMGALIGYMSWVAVETGSPAVDGGVSMMLSSAVMGTLITMLVSQSFRSGQNSRAINELSFRFLYSATSFLFFYQYLTTTIDISGNNLQKDNTALYGLALLTWCLWGIAVGNNLATIGQKKISPLGGTTHPLTMQELTKTLSLTLSAPK